MLDADLKSQLKTYMEQLSLPIEIVASLDNSATSQEMQSLLKDIADVCDKVHVTEAHDSQARKPSFLLRRQGTDMHIRFAGLPMGHEFTSLVLALLQAGGRPPKIDEETAARVRELEGSFDFEVYMSLTCHNCPDVVQALNTMAVLNPRIRVTTIEGGAFQDEIEKREIMAVPAIFLNGQPFGQGRMELEEILAKIDHGSAERDAARLNAKEPFEVLIIGGGPAGASAAIYAARKGIRTGIAAERLGGQVLDTLSIENFISVPETEGPKFASALEAHVRAYDVDIINFQRASALVPGNLIEVQFENGGSLKARSVIISTGARWRSMDVPGETEYRTKGVTYCPHCDGPLFKGKRVAVIGGGNSGVEAAIDLAGVVAHVTLLEFAPELKADSVLQSKLRSLPNVDIIVNAQTTEVLGDGSKVNGLRYKNRENGTTADLPLEGIFVQIGLLPNTNWLKGTLELNSVGEIVVDAKGQTSVPGVFAAGDCTTVPYKQIIIACGEGAKASLAAFDYLIRSPHNG